MPTGSASEQPGGAVSEQPTASVSEQPGGAVSELPTASVSEQPGGAVSEQPTGSVSEQPGGAVSEQPTASVLEQPGGAVSEQPTASVSEQPGGAVSEQPTASVSEQPGGTVSEQPAVSQKPTASAMEAILKVSPLPKCEKPRVRKRAAESSEHLTGTPYKKKLLQKAEYGREKLAKKSGKVQKVLTYNTSAGKETKQKQTKKRKKLTCREDKPRGRPSSTKGKVVQKKANQQLKIKAASSKLKKVCTDSRPQIDSEYLVCFCGEMFMEPPTEPWIQCKTCKRWLHEACTAGEGPYGFVCDYCL